MEILNDFIGTLDCSVTIMWASYFVLFMAVYEIEYAIQKRSSKDVAIKER